MILLCYNVLLFIILLYISFNYLCVCSSVTGGWSGEGLITIELDGKISCQSRHLTSFVILVDYTGVIADQKVPQV